MLIIGTIQPFPFVCEIVVRYQTCYDQCRLCWHCSTRRDYSQSTPLLKVTEASHRCSEQCNCLHNTTKYGSFSTFWLSASIKPLGISELFLLSPWHALQQWSEIKRYLTTLEGLILICTIPMEITLLFCREPTLTGFRPSIVRSLSWLLPLLIATRSPSLQKPESSGLHTPPARVLPAF